MKKILLILILLFYADCLAQKHIVDSLITVANNQETDSLKIDLLNKDFFKYVYSEPEVARLISDYTIANTNNTTSPFQQAQSLIRKGIYYDVISKKDSALILYDQAYEIAAPLKDYISMGNVYNDKGLVYWNRDELELAMEQFLKGADAFKRVNNENGLSSIYNNIGLILYDLGRYQESTASHHKALKIRLKNNDTYGLGASYSNLSNSLKREMKRDSSMYYMRKAIEIKKQSNDKRGLAIAYQNLGIDFRESRVLDSALYYTNKAKLLYEEIGNKRLLANNLVTIAEMYQLAGKYDDGIASIKAGIQLMDEKEYKRLAEMEVIYARLLAYKNDHEESANAYARALEYRDFYVETERTAQAQEYYEKYQSAQKEQEIAEQRAELAENELDLEKNKRTIYALIGGVLLISLIGFFFYRQQKIRNEQKVKENELQLALAQIETQNKLQEQRLRISRDLHDNIGSQLTFLISSIDNLKFAQNVEKQTTNSKLGVLSSFTRKTMGELRDTIWAMNKKEISLEDLEERTTTLVSQLRHVLEDKTKIITDFNHKEPMVFNSVNGMHIFRIIQESINNAVKYANADEIKIETLDHLSGIKIKISDNGSGFDRNNYEAGNGLKNMKDRAALLDAELVVKSQVDGGTQIELLIPKRTT